MPDWKNLDTGDTKTTGQAAPLELQGFLRCSWVVGVGSKHRITALQPIKIDGQPLAAHDSRILNPGTHTIEVGADDEAERYELTINRSASSGRGMADQL